MGPSSRPERSAGIDFPALREGYESRLTNGERAELRRVRSPEALELLPAYYRLIPGRSGPSWVRVAFLLPFARHQLDAPPLGAQLAKARVSDRRLFQVLRSHYPNDIIQLRRLLQHVDPAVDWRKFGQTVFLWDRHERVKRRIVEDYFMAIKD